MGGRGGALVALALTLAPLQALGEETAATSGIARILVEFRPFATLVPGPGTSSGRPAFGVDLPARVEYASMNGIWLSLATVLSFGNFLVWFDGTVIVGYSAEWFAVGACAETGQPLVFPRLGPTVRIGRLNGVFGTMRLQWSVAPYRYVPYLPSDAEVELTVPVSDSWRLQLRGEYQWWKGLWGMVGAQHYLRGSGLGATHSITFAAGVRYLFEPQTLGPTVSVGYEYRW